MSNELGFEKHFKDASEIREVIDKVGEVCGEYDTFAVLMGCLGIALYINKPDLTRDQMEKGIMDTSEWIALYVSSLGHVNGDSPVDPKKVN